MGRLPPRKENGTVPVFHSSHYQGGGPLNPSTVSRAFCVSVAVVDPLDIP